MFKIIPILLAALIASSADAQQQKTINYVVFDGGKYKGEELKWASANPKPSTTPYLDKSNWLIIPRAVVNHYYVP